MDPSTPIRREPAAGHDAVQVRMQLELARPGVQYGGDAEQRAELRPASHVEQRGARRAEEQVVDKARSIRRERAQRRGECEDDVEVSDRQNPHEPLCDPFLLRKRLTLGAVPISARVVRRLLVAARGAHVEMTTERYGPAERDGRKCATLIDAQRVHSFESPAVSANDVAHLEAWAFACGALEVRRHCSR